MSANHIYNASRVEVSCSCERGAGYCCARCGKVVCGLPCRAFCNRYDDCPGSRPTLDQVDGIILMSCAQALTDDDCGIDEDDYCAYWRRCYRPAAALSGEAACHSRRKDRGNGFAFDDARCATRNTDSM